MKKYLLVSIIMALSTSASWADNAQEQQARELARAAAVAAAKAGGKSSEVIMSEPARSYFDWGAILNPEFKIMSVRTGSVADTMGIQRGDILLRLNGLATEQAQLSEIIATIESLDHGTQLAAVISRNGQPQNLSGIVNATVIPGWRMEVDSNAIEEQYTQAATGACGRVSVFQQPPQTRDLYPARFGRIDDDDTFTSRSIIKLGVGEHTIGLYEQITDPNVRRSATGRGEHVLKITIEANQKYHLAAEFLPNNRYRTRTEEYWQPVVWKVTEASCELE